MAEQCPGSAPGAWRWASQAADSYCMALQADRLQSVRLSRDACSPHRQQVAPQVPYHDWPTRQAPAAPLPICLSVPLRTWACRRTLRVAGIEEVAIAQQGLARACAGRHIAPGQVPQVGVDAGAVRDFKVHASDRVCVLVPLQAVALLHSYLCRHHAAVSWELKCSNMQVACSVQGRRPYIKLPFSHSENDNWPDF